MKILFVTQYFPPEIGAASIRVYEITKRWVHKGHNVDILTGFPNYPTGEVPAIYRKKLWKIFYSEKMDGMKVNRVWLYATPYLNAFQRIMNYTSFLISSFIRGLFLKKSDVIVATSPPLLVGLTGLLIGRLKNTPFVLDVRDLWPESLVAANVSTKDKFDYRMLDKIAMYLYKKSNAVIVVTDGFKRQLIHEKKIVSEKIHVVKNGVEPLLFKPIADVADTKQKFRIAGKFVVSYFGTIGISHGVESILEAAKSMITAYSDILFLIIGEGASKKKVLEIIGQQLLSNVICLGNQPREMIPDLICSSDACIVSHINSQIFDTFIPSKMLEYMACERPIIAAVAGEAAHIIEQANAGIIVEREKPEEMKKAIISLYQNPELREQLGKKGRAFVLQHYTREKFVAEYEQILIQIMQSSPRHQGTKKRSTKN